MKLDYSLSTYEERKKFCEQYIATHDYIPQKELTYMADYLLFTADRKTTFKERKTEYPITTQNREVTITKRTTSLDTLITDGSLPPSSDYRVYHLDALDAITQTDREHPYISANLTVIDSLKKQLSRATEQSSLRYSLKQQIISKYKQIYAIKSSSFPTTQKAKRPFINALTHLSLPDLTYIGEDNLPHDNSPISLFDPSHVSFLLCNFDSLYRESYDNMQSDIRWLLDYLSQLIDQTFSNSPILYDLIRLEILGYSGADICEIMEIKHSIIHTEQYFSTMWRKRIPKLITNQATRNYLIYYYRKHNLPQKTCGKCGQTFPAHPHFFHRNSSQDGFYSICKKCRKGGDA